MIYDHVLDLLGNTPVVSLRKLFADVDINVFAKLEGYNPSGSAKDRPALNMLLDGIKKGKINQDTTIIESSSGNLAIGLSQVCRYLGLKLICVVDIKTTIQNQQMISIYGTRVEVVTEPDPISGEFLPARLKRIKELREEIPNSYWPNQYANHANPESHYLTTMKEIAKDFNNNIDYLFIAVSTCGTIRGCFEYIEDQQLPTKIVAVDAKGSVIFGQPPGKRLLPGHGAGIVPPNCSDELADEVVYISDLDCVIGCRSLLYNESILAGASAGGIITAVVRLAPRLPPNSNCVLILADRGERYLDTVYSDEWVLRHFGHVPDIEIVSEKTSAVRKNRRISCKSFDTDIELD